MTIKELLEKYEQITIERTFGDDTVMFLLFEKTFLIRYPNKDLASSCPCIYLYNDEGFNFPHIMLKEETISQSDSFPEGKYRFVCLYEKESIVFSLMTFEEKIQDIINRLIELLSMSQIERNREFQKEYMYYWNCSSSGSFVDVFLKDEFIFSRMEVYSGTKGTRYIQLGLELNDLNYRNKNRLVWMPHIESDIFYVPIIDSRDILPPYKGYAWSLQQIKDIFFGKQIEHISSDTFEQLKKEVVTTQYFIIVFGMIINKSKITFSIKIKAKNSNKKSLFQKLKDDVISVETLKTVRKDYSFLSSQLGNDTSLQGKKVLLIGAGSLGSYVAFEIVKNGANSLTIYDADKLYDDNILRYSFGIFKFGLPKPELLKLQLELLHPEIKINAINKYIDSKTLIEESQTADLIIFTIGNSDSQLVFNKVLHDSQCKAKVIYSWIEAGGKNSHILTVDYSKPGCYECLFTDNNGELINNKASLNTDSFTEENIIKNGCGGTRAAYGTTVLLRTTAALLETVKRIISGELQNNTLINITPNSVINNIDVLPSEVCKCCGNKGS